MQDPLIQFVIIGVALFMTYQVFNDETEIVKAKRIIIDKSILEVLAGTFERSWLRKPSPVEMQGLVQDHLKEEILYREALALGLDKNDPIIRRRLRQKMEFLNQDISDPPKASDEVLQQFLDKHKDRFTKPPKMSFQQVFFSFGSSGQGKVNAAARLARLGGLSPGETDLATIGDPTLLTKAMRDVDPTAIGRIFGSEFAKQLFTLPTKEWVGPIKSGFGFHLVYIFQIMPGSAPSLAEVRKAVEGEWLAEQREIANERFFKILHDRYTIEIYDDGSYGSDEKTKLQ